MGQSYENLSALGMTEVVVEVIQKHGTERVTNIFI
jgi:hypothetical protein